MLGAALAVATTNVVDKAAIARPLKWLDRLCQTLLTTVTRQCRIQPDYFTLLTFDGSFTGGGAITQIGVPSLQQAAGCQIVAYLAFQRTEAELDLVGVRRGSTAGHARLEALTLLTALNSWSSILATAQGRLAI